MNTMQSKRIKYDKWAEITVDGKTTTLIDHLKQIRVQEHITKKKISQIIKGNTYWYSQLERNGKKGDDNRRKYIEENELINIISVIEYGAKNMEDLSKCQPLSIQYIGNLHLSPIDSRYRYPSQMSKYLDKASQYNLILSLLNSIQKAISEYVNNAERSERDRIIELLKNFSRTLNHNPKFALELAGLEIAPIFDKDSAIISYTFLNEIQSLLDKHELENNYISPQELGEAISKCYDNYKNIAGHLFESFKKYDIKF